MVRSSRPTKAICSTRDENHLVQRRREVSSAVGGGDRRQSLGREARGCSTTRSDGERDVIPSYVNEGAQCGGRIGGDKRRHEARRWQECLMRDDARRREELYTLRSCSNTQIESRVQVSRSEPKKNNWVKLHFARSGVRMKASSNGGQMRPNQGTTDQTRPIGFRLTKLALWFRMT